MAGVAMRMMVLTLLTFKKVKLIFGHPVWIKKKEKSGLTNLMLGTKTTITIEVVTKNKILFCYCCLLVLSTLWFLSLALTVGHLVLFLLFLLVPSVQWFLSLVVVHYFLFLFWFPAISVAFWHCNFIKLVYLAIFLLFSIPLYPCFGPWCVLCTCQLDPPLTTKLWIKRLLSLSIQKITVIWHVKPGEKLQWTWQIPCLMERAKETRCAVLRLTILPQLIPNIIFKTLITMVILDGYSDIQTDSPKSIMGCFTIRVHHLSHFWWKMKCFVIPQHAFFCVMNKPYIDYIKLLTYRHNLSWIQLK